MSTAKWTECLRVWQGQARGESVSNWPKEGVAIEGDFAGIQRFILKPVPGARGAAKRLRGRSLLVIAYTELIARRVAEGFQGAAKLYSAGGRFLISTLPDAAWDLKIQVLQRELDAWAYEQFQGEVVFHLAAAPFADGRIPRTALHAAMQRRRQIPLAGWLTESGGGWNTEQFYRPAGSTPFQCPACRSTASTGVVQPDEEDLEDPRICLACDRDKRIGGRLALLSRCNLASGDGGAISFGGTSYDLGENGPVALSVVHHIPRKGKEPMSLEDLSRRSLGREWLGFLRLDADHIGEAFRQTDGVPERVRGLSLMLNGYFCDRVQELISSRYRLIYPVYGGGDDLFVIGPWDMTLDLAIELEKEFRAGTGGKLSFSAGLALSKPRQHILTKSAEAEEALNDHAKKGRNSIRALGETLGWAEASQAIEEAKQVVAWHKNGEINSAFLRDVLVLHREWKQPDGVRYRAMLHRQIERNVRRDGAGANWARSLLGAPEVWARAGFVARYALVASEAHKKEVEG